MHFNHTTVFFKTTKSYRTEINNKTRTPSPITIPPQHWKVHYLIDPKLASPVPGPPAARPLRVPSAPPAHGPRRDHTDPRPGRARVPGSGERAAHVAPRRQHGWPHCPRPQSSAPRREAAPQLRHTPPLPRPLRFPAAGLAGQGASSDPDQLQTPDLRVLRACTAASRVDIR